MEEESKKLWPQKPFQLKTVIPTHNTFIIKCHSKEDYDDILKQEPWFVLGYLLLLEKFVPEIPNKVQIKRQKFWIRLCNLDVTFLYPKIIREILEPLGTYIDMLPRNGTPEKGKMVKVPIAMDIAAPLVRGFWQKTLSGEEIWIEFYYEKQPQHICHKCYIIDHQDIHCKYVEEDLLMDMFGMIPPEDELKAFISALKYNFSSKEDTSILIIFNICLKLQKN